MSIHFFSLRHLLPVFGAVVVLSGCSGNSRIQGPLPAVTGARSPEFRREMGALLGAGLTTGNRIETLNNGNEIFPAMLRAIRGARRTVNFETYVFESGEVPRLFADALTERARAGVRVNAILDAHGAKKSRRYHAMMRAAGVNLEMYHSIFWWDFRRYNFRTHRKLLIVDGKAGFIGGVGIADEWAGDARSPVEWRDIQYRVEGPAVAQLQAAFADNWFETRGDILQGAGYFPPLQKAGPAAASVFPSAPKQSEFAIELMYHLAIASARESILIENAYFLPDENLVEALAGAAQRGVKVQVVMPGEHIDQKAVRRASQKRWPKLLEAGVQLFEFEPTMIHTKLLIVDGIFVGVGSANFDPRSLRINDEANMNVLDRGFAADQTRIFQRDLARSRQVNPEDFGIERAAQLPVQALQTPLEPQL